MPKTTKLGFNYPEEGTVEWFQTFKALVDDGIDAYLYAATRKLIPLWAAPGFTWVTGSPRGTLSWTPGTVKWSNPYTGEQLVLRQSSVGHEGEITVVDGEFVYLVVVEGSGPTIYVEAQTATQIALNPGGVLVIGQRVGNSFYLAPNLYGRSI